LIGIRSIEEFGNCWEELCATVGGLPHYFVERYYIPFFEVIPSAPAYVLDSDEKYTAGVTTPFHRARVANGNTTVQVHARPVNTSIWAYRLVSEEHPPWV
jgi:CD109 antigen